MQFPYVSRDEKELYNILVRDWPLISLISIVNSGLIVL